MPYILFGGFTGAFVDAHRKKTVMLVCDAAAALCSLAVFALTVTERLALWHIYVANAAVGVMNAFQSPAAAVATGLLMPKEKVARASGLNAFASNLLTVTAPMLAASFMGFGGLQAVIAFDLLSFCAAAALLARFVPLHEKSGEAPFNRGRLLRGAGEGFSYLLKNRGVLYLILSFACMNFFSRLTYENILSPMILARSGGNTRILALVTGIVGAGGMIGGLAVALMPRMRDARRLIYLSAFLSFLLGDLLMGLGRGPALWSVAAFFASAPIPLIGAGQNVLLYASVPHEMQGRVFAARNTIQYFTIPLGILLGGLLADRIFGPFLDARVPLALALARIVGPGTGGGMAVMFLCTGVLGALTSILWLRSRSIRALSDRVRWKGEE